MRSVLLAVVAVGLVGSLLGCSKAHTDDSISNDIKASMFSDPQTKSANVSVVVKNGAVTLTGEVPDENARYEAFKIAKQTPGVVNVEDQMSLPQNPVPRRREPPKTVNLPPLPRQFQRLSANASLKSNCSFGDRWPVRRTTPPTIRARAARTLRNSNRLNHSQLRPQLRQRPQPSVPTSRSSEAAGRPAGQHPQWNACAYPND